jgi:Histidine phosphatase superfamily (branch 1)
MSARLRYRDWFVARKKDTTNEKIGIGDRRHGKLTLPVYPAAFCNTTVGQQSRIKTNRLRMIVVPALHIRHLVGLLLIPWVSTGVSAFLGHQQPRASHVLFGENGEPNGVVQSVNGLSRTDESTLLSDRSYGTQLMDSKGRFLPNPFGRRKSPSNLADQEENEDGWKDMRKRDRPMWGNILRFPFKSSVRALFPKSTPEPGTLILVRHGESTWNANKTFTGWADPDLSERGRREVEHAARLLLEGVCDMDCKIAFSVVDHGAPIQLQLLFSLEVLFLTLFLSIVS